MYLVNSEYKSSGKYLSYNELDKLLRDSKQFDYLQLKQKVAQQTLMLLDKNYKSYFKALKSYNTNPSKFTGKPQLPKYLNKLKGRFVTTFTNQTISLKELKKGYILLSGTDIKIKSDKQPKQVRVLQLNTGSYKIEILYEKLEYPLTINDNYCGIDLGLDNLATCVTNTKLDPFIINGKPLKSINQYYNKQLAKYKSELPKYKLNSVIKQKNISKKISKLTHKRNCKIMDYLHKGSRLITNKLKQNDISKVVIGQNKDWKQNINIGNKNNQNFVSIPHSKFIELITYKCKLEGIDVIVREESYTSKCSFLDGEIVKKHDKYKGSRVKRGLFKTSTGFKWNADCNGACNILIKEVPNAYANGIEGVVVHPLKYNC
jgi:putative transposase